jgi:large subunit ribosomal protein L21
LLFVSETKAVPLQPNLKLNHKIMYAIVEIAGQQFKVEKDRYLYTHRLVGEVGAALVFDKVLLVDNEGDIKIGLPTVTGASVSGKILAHVRGEKVLVFKKKRRKGYQKQNGHRQDFTKVLVEGITF